MKKLSTHILFAIFALALSFTFTQCGSKESKEDMQVGILFSGVAKAASKSCPTMIDEITRLDSCSFTKVGRVFTYHYTIVDESQFDLNLLKAQGEPAMREFVKTSHEMADFRKFKLTVKYEYTNTERNLLHQVLITPEDYK